FRAARDRGNDYRTVFELVALPVMLDAHREKWLRLTRVGSPLLRGFLVDRRAGQRRKGLPPARLRLGRDDAVLWPGRAGDGRHYCAEVELEGVREDRFYRGVRAEEALLAAVGFDQTHLVLIAAGEAHVGQGLRVDGEETDRSAILG